MTVKQLREALAPFHDNHDVVVEGTSVEVIPFRAVDLATLKSMRDDIWPFEHCSAFTVVLLTQYPSQESL